MKEKSKQGDEIAPKCHQVGWIQVCFSFDAADDDGHDDDDNVADFLLCQTTKQRDGLRERDAALDVAALFELEDDANEVVVECFVMQRTTEEVKTKLWLRYLRLQNHLLFHLVLHGGPFF